MPQSKKVLSVFSLVMINVIAVDSLRTLPLTAKLGLHLVAFYFVAALIFFIPVALVAADYKRHRRDNRIGHEVDRRHRTIGNVPRGRQRA